MATAPAEPRGGQDDQPDLDQLLLVVLILLADLRDHIRGDNQRNPNEMVTRIRAVSAVIRRVRGATP